MEELPDQWEQEESIELTNKMLCELADTTTDVITELVKNKQLRVFNPQDNRGRHHRFPLSSALALVLRMQMDNKRRSNTMEYQTRKAMVKEVSNTSWSRLRTLIDDGRVYVFISPYDGHMITLRDSLIDKCPNLLTAYQHLMSKLATVMEQCAVRRSED